MENGNGYYQKLGVYQGSNPQCDQYIDRYNLYADSGRAGVTGDSSDEHMFECSDAPERRAHSAELPSTVRSGR